jgi:toxin HigB-1
MWRVVWSSKVEKQLRKVPDYIAEKFRAWARAVEEDGLPTVRRLPGLHDEPLKGDRQGQRSIRLNRAYRAIYVERDDGEVELVEVIEVNKHEY